MAAQLTSSGAIIPPESVADHVHALMDLAEAAHAITAHSSNHSRLRLNNAVARVLRMFRLHGLAAAPLMSRDQARETFRQAYRLALAAGVERRDLVAIFNNEEEPAAFDDGRPVRRDLQ